MIITNRAGFRIVRRICTMIHNHAPTTASSVTHPWAWSTTAMTPPQLASNTAGNVNGSTQHDVHATAARAEVIAVPEAMRPVFLSSLLVAGAQPQPGEFSVGKVQWSPITLM
jgi:hypothetical protein